MRENRVPLPYKSFDSLYVFRPATAWKMMSPNKAIAASIEGLHS